MRQSGVTTGGQPVIAGIFALIGTHGVPLELILAHFHEAGMVMDWPEQSEGTAVTLLSLDQCDLIARCAVDHVIQERPNQDHTAASYPHEILGIEGLVEGRDVETGSLVADGDPDLFVVDPRLQVDSTMTVWLDGSPLGGLVVEMPFVLLPEVGATLEVSVIEGIREAFLEGDGDPRPRGLVPYGKVAEIVLDQVDQFGKEVGVIA